MVRVAPGSCTGSPYSDKAAMATRRIDAHSGTCVFLLDFSLFKHSDRCASHRSSHWTKAHARVGYCQTRARYVGVLAVGKRTGFGARGS